MHPLNWWHFAFTFLSPSPPQFLYFCSSPSSTHLPSPQMLNLQMEFKPPIVQKTCPDTPALLRYLNELQPSD